MSPAPSAPPWRGIADGMVYQRRRRNFRGPWTWKCDECGANGNADGPELAHRELTAHFWEAHP